MFETVEGRFLTDLVSGSGSEWSRPGSSHKPPSVPVEALPGSSVVHLLESIHLQKQPGNTTSHTISVGSDGISKDFERRDPELVSSEGTEDFDHATIPKDYADGKDFVK